MSIFLRPLDKINRSGSNPPFSIAKLSFFLLLLVFILILNFRSIFSWGILEFSRPSKNEAKKMSAILLKENFSRFSLAAYALNQTRKNLKYDSSYRKISYPGGDIPSGIGSSVDLLIRVYRQIGIDLQKQVHEDILNSPQAYPHISRPDSNIDHRRIKNLQTFLSHYSKNLSVRPKASEFAIGDIVFWKLPEGIVHLGIVVPGPRYRKNEKWVVHNSGNGPKWKNELFAFPIIFHYQFPIEK